MGTLPIISQCALSRAQQSFSWLLCECCLVLVAVTGQLVVDHQLRDDGWFLNDWLNRNNCNLSPIKTGIHTIINAQKCSDAYKVTSLQITNFQHMQASNQIRKRFNIVSGLNTKIVSDL